MARAFTLIFFISCFMLYSNGRVYPGTENRPVLSDQEASKYTLKNYLLGWEPEEIVIPDDPDYVVKPGESIQEVVNKAIESGDSYTRIYIRIEPGYYEETVYINGNVPITIYGGGNSPADVTILSTLSEILTASDYRNWLNTHGWRYKKGDQAWDLYNYCATKEGTIGLECSAILWVNSPNFQLYGLTVYNVATYAAGVSIRTAVDKISLVNSHLRGFANTVGLGIGDDENEDIERVYVHNCYIEGETDFVFGGATAIFNMTTFMITALAEVDAPVIFAPDTSPQRSYGFLVINSNITGFEQYKGSGKDTMKTYVSVLLALTLALHSSARSYPGTKTRPILSDKEASRYTVNNYLSGWEPEEIVIPDKPDYVVSAGQSIQEVVNKAIKEGGRSNRIYIKIEPGHYVETVYIRSNDSLTIYGDPKKPEDIHIMATLSAKTSTSDYEKLVNVNGTRYIEGDPAWQFYNSCITKEVTIGTGCSAVFWIESSNFQLAGVTIHNGATDAQALAIRTAADKIHLMNNRFLGMQDTVGLAVGSHDTNGQRVLVHKCYIEGEVDYVYGNAAAVFKMTTFNTVAKIKKSHPVIFAPDTDPWRSYGFLVINSTITADASYIGSNQGRLARAWDQGIKKAELYVPGKSTNGQLVIRDSIIDNVIDVEAPYAPAAGSGRPFTSDINPSRVLDDNSHNRMWEYNNSGDGA